jgi:hypothetical protein
LWESVKTPSWTIAQGAKSKFLPPHSTEFPHVLQQLFTGLLVRKSMGQSDWQMM